MAIGSLMSVLLTCRRAILGVNFRRAESVDEQYISLVCQICVSGMPDETKHALSRDNAIRVANDFMLANQQMGRNLIEAGKARNKHRVLDVIIEYAVSQI